VRVERIDMYLTVYIDRCIYMLLDGIDMTYTRQCRYILDGIYVYYMYIRRGDVCWAYI
jgi:hypothetical protein